MRLLVFSLFLVFSISHLVQFTHNNNNNKRENTKNPHNSQSPTTKSCTRILNLTSSRIYSHLFRRLPLSFFLTSIHSFSNLI